MIRMGVGSQLLRISGSTVLITGATGGLGKAIARRLGKLGAVLILTGRRVAVLDALAAELGARPVVADLSLPEDLERVAAASGEVDILIANAGLPASGTLESFSVEEIDRALDVNLRAPIVLARELAPRMVDRGQGHLLFMSSLAGKASTPRTALYNATKFGLRGFAGALRSDLRGTGVGVSAIFPGFIRDAGLFADADVKLPPGVGTRSPDQVADAVVSAIERNRGEVEVAPLPVRAGTLLASVAPAIAGTIARRLGSDEIARKMQEGQSEKR
jgi:uncharacterized protein